MKDDVQTDYDMSIHHNPDARAWAKFYTETRNKSADPANFDDEENMIGWFANAMMAMYDSKAVAETDAVAPDDTRLVSGVSSDPPPIEAEPVAWQLKSPDEDDDCWQECSEQFKEKYKSEPRFQFRPLYATPPTPERIAVIEECAKVAERYRRKVLGRDLSKATYDPAGRWEGGVIYEGGTFQEGIAKAIRSLALPPKDTK